LYDVASTGTQTNNLINVYQKIRNENYSPYVVSSDGDMTDHWLRITYAGTDCDGHGSCI
jgi:hypothetical protein